MQKRDLINLTGAVLTVGFMGVAGMIRWQLWIMGPHETYGISNGKIAKFEEFRKYWIVENRLILQGIEPRTVEILYWDMFFRGI